MAGRHRRRQHGRRVRIDHSFVSGTQREPRSVFPRGFSRYRQQELARRQRSQEIGQWLAVRAAALRFAVFCAWFLNQRQSRGRVVNSFPAIVVSAGAASRLGQVEHHDTLGLRNSRLALGDSVDVNIRRFDLDDGGVRYQQFKVPYRKSMRVLDALNWIAEHEATDLAFRWICGSKMCGSCALRMQLRLLKIDSPELTQFAAQLSVGKIYANGHGFVPLVRTAIYDRLLQLSLI